MRGGFLRSKEDWENSFWTRAFFGMLMELLFLGMFLFLPEGVEKGLILVMMFMVVVLVFFQGLAFKIKFGHYPWKELFKEDKKEDKSELDS